MTYNCYESILSRANLEKAYYAVLQKFEEESKVSKYYSLDGLHISDYDFDSVSLIDTIEYELKNKTKIQPALKIEIPKKNKKGNRSIYIHVVKERIKAQAIYQVVEPVFEKIYTNYLFSYRKTRPYHTALRTVVRRYASKKEQHILIGDVSNYSDTINPVILKQKIKEIDFDTDTFELLSLYLNCTYIEDGVEKRHEKGILTGLPITVMFNNLYLNNMDKEIGKKSALYRRIGDDFIVFDSLENLSQIEKKIETELISVDISIEKQRMELLSIDEKFTFLGYDFEKGSISISSKTVSTFKIFLRKKLRYSKLSLVKKQRKLYSILYAGEHSIFINLKQLIRQYPHLNNYKQINEITRYLETRITIFLFGTYSQRNYRKTKEHISKFKEINLKRLYIKFHSGNYTMI